MEYTLDQMPTWLEERVLLFLNAIENAKELSKKVSETTENSITTDSSEYTIGNRVAKRIIEIRDQLPNQKFSNLKELREVRGMGPDKVQTIVKQFNRTSSDELKEELFISGILKPKNWSIFNHRTELPDREEYNKISSNKYLLREHVVGRVRDLCSEKEIDIVKCELVSKILQFAYIDTYSSNKDAAALAFALWFYCFDNDKWFSHEQILSHIKRYFNTYKGGSMGGMNLYIFKPFDHELIAEGTVSSGLPVVCCDAEASVTIWTGALYNEIV